MPDSASLITCRLHSFATQFKVFRRRIATAFSWRPGAIWAKWREPGKEVLSSGFPGRHFSHCLIFGGNNHD